MHASKLFDLAGAVAVVTGASSGLGARFARVLAANGAHVVCVARRVERLSALVKEIEGAGGKALAAAADVTDHAAMARALDAAMALKPATLVLVNNAGMAVTGRAMDLPEKAWRDTMAVDLDSLFFWAQAAAQRMVAAGIPGVVVNTASVAAYGATRGMAAYSVAKAGVVQLTRALALEFAAKNIRVNAIAPGYFITEINHDYLLSERGQLIKKAIPLGRFGAEGDLDGVMLLLASKAGAFITGATYAADGGQMIQMAG